MPVVRKIPPPPIDQADDAPDLVGLRRSALIGRAHAVGLKTQPQDSGLRLWWPGEDTTGLTPLPWEQVDAWLNEYATDGPPTGTMERTRPEPTQELVIVEADDVPLTSAEQRSLLTHEATIQAGIGTFAAVVLALAAINQDRLYRRTHRRFEDYIADRWPQYGSVRQVYRAIAAAEVVESVTNWSQNEGVSVPPIANESQARILAQLPAEERGPVYAAAVASAPNGKPTARHIEQAVDQARETPKPPALMLPELPPELTGWRWSTNPKNGAHFLMHPDAAWTFTTRQYPDPQEAIAEAAEWSTRQVKPTPPAEPPAIDPALIKRLAAFGWSLEGAAFDADGAAIYTIADGGTMSAMRVCGADTLDNLVASWEATPAPRQTSMRLTWTLSDAAAAAVELRRLPGEANAACADRLLAALVSKERTV